MAAGRRRVEGADTAKYQADHHQVQNHDLCIDAMDAAYFPSNPNNPTGAIIKKSLLTEIVEIAREHGIIILSDEVYRPLFHSIGPMDAEFPPSILSMSYEKTIATGSLSKAYALAGIRVGWIASRSREIINACAQARDYSTISVSQVDDDIASFALSSETVHSLLGRVRLHSPDGDFHLLLKM